jgi:uncharacterized protein (UPF0332 family)
LPVSLGKTLRDLVDLREAADYDLEIKNIENVTKQYYQQTEIFLNEVEKYVKAKNQGAAS